MELRDDEDAAARDAVSGEKGDLLRDRGARAGMGVVQRDDERFLGDGLLAHQHLITSQMKLVEESVAVVEHPANPRS